jgi:hypothetical protein
MEWWRPLYTRKENAAGWCGYSCWQEVAGASFWDIIISTRIKRTAEIPVQNQSLPKEEPKKLPKEKNTLPVISQTQIQKNHRKRQL